MFDPYAITMGREAVEDLRRSFNQAPPRRRVRAPRAPRSHVGLRLRTAVALRRLADRLEPAPAR
jgi:hypothetical protein